MRRSRKGRLSKELGLGLGLVAGRYVVGMEELHFGYWPEDLPVERGNLPRAQEAFNEIILEHVPKGARTVLEVGCGTGGLARRLAERGLRVDVVSPSSYLTSVARERLGDSVGFFECRFEELVSERRWDLVLFSESFQYLEPGSGLERAAELLAPGGLVLLADYFRLPAEEHSPIGGGRPLADFEAELAASSLVSLAELDLTDRVAPGFAVLEELDRDLLTPAYRVLCSSLEQGHPLIYRLLRWRYARKIRRFEAEIGGGLRGPDSFRRFKTYRLYLLGARAGRS